MRESVDGNQRLPTDSGERKKKKEAYEISKAKE